MTLALVTPRRMGSCQSLLLLGLILCGLPHLEAIEVGDKCVLKGNLPGICRTSSDCYPVIEKYFTAKRLTNRDVPSCGLTLYEEIICCPIAECCEDDNGPSQVTTTTFGTRSTTGNTITSSTTTTPRSVPTTPSTPVDHSGLRTASRQLDKDSSFFDFAQMLGEHHQQSTERQPEPVVVINDDVEELPSPQFLHGEKFQDVGPLGRVTDSNRKPKIINRPLSLRPEQIPAQIPNPFPGRRPGSENWSQSAQEIPAQIPNPFPGRRPGSPQEEPARRPSQFQERRPGFEDWSQSAQEIPAQIPSPFPGRRPGSPQEEPARRPSQFQERRPGFEDWSQPPQETPAQRPNPFPGRRPGSEDWSQSAQEIPAQIPNSFPGRRPGSENRPQSLQEEPSQRPSQFQERRPGSEDWSQSAQEIPAQIPNPFPGRRPGLAQEEPATRPSQFQERRPGFEDWSQSAQEIPAHIPSQIPVRRPVSGNGPQSAQNVQAQIPNPFTATRPASENWPESAQDLIHQVNDKLRQQGMDIVPATYQEPFMEQMRVSTSPRPPVAVVASVIPFGLPERPVDEIATNELGNGDALPFGTVTTTHLVIQPTPTTRVDVSEKDRPAVRACRLIEERQKENALTVHILDGIPVDAGVYPHMAALAYRDFGVLIYRCGGSLISARHVLTAAHCVSLQLPVHVRLGTVNIDTVGAHYQDIAVKDNVAIHPDYISSSKENDIAILELQKEAKLNFYVFPACLETNKADPPLNAQLFVAGWGVMNQMSRDLSKILLRAPLDFVPLRECNASFAELPTSHLHLKSGITDMLICAIDKKRNKADACQGDSGGPLILEQDIFNNKYSIVGIISSGFGCATKTPGLYTRVASYLDFIEKIVWPNDVA